MSDIGNKDVFAKNLAYYVDKSGKSRGEICEDLGIVYSTFSEWINARKYPRIDKIELLANYFGILKSQLIEDHDPPEETEKPSPPDDRWERFRPRYEVLSDAEKAKIDSILDVLLDEAEQEASPDQ